jgi:hypothetical protein
LRGHAFGLAGCDHVRLTNIRNTSWNKPKWQKLDGQSVVSKEICHDNWTDAKFCDVANLILGVVLLASPWIFDFSSGAQSQNAVVSGIVIAALSKAALMTIKASKDPAGSR